MLRSTMFYNDNEITQSFCDIWLWHSIFTNRSSFFTIFVFQLREQMIKKKADLR